MSQEKYIGMDVHQATISLMVKPPGLTAKQTLVCSVVFSGSGDSATKELSGQP